MIPQTYEYGYHAGHSMALYNSEWIAGYFTKFVCRKNVTLWASNAKYLNDESEFAYYMKALGKCIEERFSGTSGKDNYRATSLAKVLNESAEVDAPFVASFSEKPDDLNQWREYGNGTSGFSIGFPSEHLRELESQSQSGIEICSYDKAELQENVNEQLEDLEGLFQSLSDKHLTVAEVARMCGMVV